MKKALLVGKSKAADAAMDILAAAFDGRCRCGAQIDRRSVERECPGCKAKHESKAQ